MLRPFWRNLYCKSYIGTALTGLCLSAALYAQTTPLETPASVNYPGILQTFEKLIQIDNDKFRLKNDELIKSAKVFNDASSVTQLDLDPDFLNSIIMHSDPGYIKLASTSKCRFYDTLINDLLKSAEGKIKNVLITYVNKNRERESAIIPHRDFLNKVAQQECPESIKLTQLYQLKTLEETLKKLDFEFPTNEGQCHNTHLAWLNSPHTPYLCKIHEYLTDARKGAGDPKDLVQRKSVAKVLETKLTVIQKDYLKNLCENLENEKLFCEDFLNVSFWNKITAGIEDKIYVEDICQKALGTAQLSSLQLRQCLNRLKKEEDLCLYPEGRKQGLSPQPSCEVLATALNHSSLRSNYKDCPGTSDQHGVTNLARILFHTSGKPVQDYQGPCSSVSAGETLAFNKRFDNDENWKLEACYDDALREREICYKTYFGEYANQPEAYTNVVASILVKIRGADQSLKCKMIDSQDYNPLLLQFKSGCYIIYERERCYLSQCEHKIIYNDRSITSIKLKNRILLDYYPTSVRDERFSQSYILTHENKLKGKLINNLSTMTNYFKKSKGIIHGVGCAEDLLPTFFKAYSMNQCSPLPFIIDGVIKEKDQVVFVTRTALDTLQAPRLISWSTIFSAVKSYQHHQPLRIWTLHGLD